LGHADIARQTLYHWRMGRLLQDHEIGSDLPNDGSERLFASNTTVPDVVRKQSEYHEPP
jgi:hypothetical protein